MIRGCLVSGHLPTAAGAAPLVVRLAREVPYPAEAVRSVTLLAEGGRLSVDVTAEVVVEDHQPVAGRVAGVDLGVIHPYPLACPATAEALVVSGRALRAESRLHLVESKARRRAAAARAPKPGQRWLPPVAQVPGPYPTSGGPPPPAPGPSPTRSRPDGRQLGGGPTGRNPGGRRPERGPRPRGRPAPQPPPPPPGGGKRRRVLARRGPPPTRGVARPPTRWRGSDNASNEDKRRLTRH